jgi:hypothetical protein
VSSTVTGRTFVAISGNRAVGADGSSFPSGTDNINTNTAGNNYQVAPCTAAAKPLGVASYDGAVNDIIQVQTAPGRVVQVAAGGTIAAGAEVEVGSGGKAVTLASGKAAGMCLNGAVNNGVAEIKLY